ncbi:hypothetical protein [Celeribacter naphthalenivorans]|uniref:hypothetical protein n=1 Tax=Celeribacter naphthalenivorans TaxID=1614694 RepID=UPI001CF9FD91|nr:hypothetical protein [Celeribacter naphthalenivorans]
MTVKLDLSPAARQRRSNEVEARMNSVAASGDARREARKQIEQDVEREEIAALEAEAALSEAANERGRIAAIVRAGTDMGRARQALKLGLSGPISAGQAQAILGNLPRDEDLSEPALTLPAPGAFGSEAAQQERRRIASAFSHPGAKGRFRSAVALTLDGDNPIPASAIATLLASLPIDQPAPRFLSLEERDAELASFGADDGSGPMTKGEKTAAAWGRAVSEANAMIGATGEKQRPSGQPYSAADDEAFGLASQMPGGNGQ